MYSSTILNIRRLHGTMSMLIRLIGGDMLCGDEVPGCGVPIQVSIIRYESAEIILCVT